jgi:orotidine-5'-phosphate decarboxylase
VASPLVVALDTDQLGRALAWSRAAGEAAGMVKVGLELFGAEGPAAVRALAGEGRRVMLDLKLHDIPATVAGAARAAARAGAELVTVHALGGPAMLAAAVEGAGDGCRVAAVTVLTSAGPGDLAAVGLPPAAEAVPRLAELAAAAGCQALVCSPLEVAAVRTLLGEAAELICPGVRPAAASEGRPSTHGAHTSGGASAQHERMRHRYLADPLAHDQARVATPAAAMEAGASWIVVGRPVTGAADVAAAASAIRDQALAAGRARRPHPGTTP